MKKPYPYPEASGNMNPFLPLDTYIPDGEPKLFEGRVWLFGSKDEFGGEYCCHKYHAYSAPADCLTSWTDHGPIFASTDEFAAEGIHDGVDWSDGLLWAPDVAKKGDTYYLFFCLSDGSEGVAEALSPAGPYTNARRITMGGKPIEGIDPSVLEVDGEYYYTWGQGHCHMARLNEDMCSLDPDTYAESLISHDEEQQGFHEGSSLRRIGDWFVLIYASEYLQRYPNFGGRPTCLDYAVSRSLYGPYERRGCIIDNTGVDPQSWNNHGSIIKIGGQWYVFYHGSTNNSRYARRARAERIEVDEANGFIRTAKMTSSGFADALTPDTVYPAAAGYRIWGGAYFTEKDGEFPLVNVRSNTAVAFRFFDFKESRDYTLKLSGRCLKGGSVILLVNGEEKAKASWDDTTGSTLRLNAGELCGRADVKLLFSAAHGEEILELHSLEFC